MNSGKILMGSIFIIIGVGLFLSQIGLGDFWAYIWPLFIITFGGYVYATKRSNFGLVIIVFGILFLLSGLFGWSVWSVMWPLVIIFVGVMIITGGSKVKLFNTGSGSSDGDMIDESAVFWGLEKRYSSKKFKGGDSFTLFGGSKLDLRNVEIAKEGAKLDVTAVFGGTEIMLPPDMSVDVLGQGIFGGWENKSTNKKKGKATLVIDGEAIFGAVEIHN